VTINRLPNGLKFENNIISGVPMESGVFTSTVKLFSRGAETKYLLINWNISDAMLPINISGLSSKLTINSSIMLSGLAGIV
jgi:hypothetical protein